MRKVLVSIDGLPGADSGSKGKDNDKRRNHHEGEF